MLIKYQHLAANVFSVIVIIILWFCVLLLPWILLSPDTFWQRCFVIAITLFFGMFWSVFCAILCFAVWE